MIYKKSVVERSMDFLIYIFLLVLTFVTLYPVWHVVMASISDGNLLMSRTGILLWPAGFSFDAYNVVMQNPAIMAGYTNTLLYVFFGTALNLFLTILGAYVLSRRNFLWRTPAMIMIVVTMFFSGGMIPDFLLVEGLNLIDTPFALIFPSAINTFNLIIMRTAFATVPDALEESAKLEGANDITILFKIYLPISKAVLAVMLLYYAVAHWNSWFPAMLYLRSRALYPLQLILREILIMNSLDSMRGNIEFADLYRVADTIKYATIVVSTLPILLLYPFLQKYFVTGVMIGALKG
jgi:putative aldouronate transport system permease protein